jgi:DNA-binding MarR family transcriptional regulator
MPSKKTASSLVMLEEHLCYQLYNTSLKLTQLYKPLLAELNLTYPQYLVMIVLWERDGIGIKELAQRMGQDPGSITPLVKRLATEGYVLRARDPEDERNVVLTLTKSGRDLRIAGNRVNTAISQVCSMMQEDLQHLMSNIQTLNQRISAQLP